MSFLPGWDSLEAITGAEHTIGVVVLALVAVVAVAGIAAYGCEYRAAALARGAPRVAHPQLAAWDTGKTLATLRMICAAVASVAIVLFIVGEVIAQQYAGRRAELTSVVERARTDSAQQELARLNSEPTQLRTDMDALRGELAQARAAKEQADAGRGRDVAALRDELARSKAAAEQADAGHIREIAALRAQLANAEQQIKNLTAQLANRRLTDAEKQTLIAALKPFPGQKVSVASISGDDDGKRYAEDFVAVLDAVGWDHGGEAGVTTQTWDRDPIGIEVTLNEADGRAGRIPAGVGALINAVRTLGLVADNSVFMNADIPSGEVQIRVGRKLRR